MAQAGVVLEKDQFNCSICLDVLKGPVTIPCGHSYCSDCIRNYWDQGVFMCPQCRQEFMTRPTLARNTMLAEVVEKFKKTSLQEAASKNVAGADDVECDVCTGRKIKAVKSCLVCLASYCDVHVQPHYDSAAFKRHKLVSASKKLQEKFCPRHDKLLEVYCRTDNQCICYLCLAYEHKGHDTVLVEAETQHRQRLTVEVQQSSQLLAQELTQAIFSINRSARAAEVEAEATFTEIIQSFKLKCLEARELIKAREKTVISQTEQLLDKIQKQNVELKKTEDELNQLSQTEDHVHFLQNCHSVHAPPVLSALPAVIADPKLNFGSFMKALSDYKRHVQEVSQESFDSICKTERDSTNHAAQIDTTQSGDAGSHVQIQPAIMFPSSGLDQSPINPHNPFLTPGPPVTMFAFGPPFGAKLSTGSRHRQRRPHSKRK